MSTVICDFEESLDVPIFHLFEGDFDSDDWISIGTIKVNDIELDVSVDWDEGDFFIYVYGEVSSPSGEISGSHNTPRGDTTLRKALLKAVADLEEFSY